MAFFKRRKREEYYKQEDNRIIMQRDNGTILTLIPALDQNGNLETKNVYNRFGEVCRIPKFHMSCPELEEISPNLLSTDIFLDVPLEWLGQSEGKRLISEKLLSSKRIQKIVNEYKGYTGTLQYDEQSGWGKVLDIEILKQIQYEDLRNRQARESSKREEFLKNISNIPENYPTGEVDFKEKSLTPEMKPKCWEEER